MKATMRYHYTSIRMIKISNIDNTKCWRGCGATGTVIHCWWKKKMVQPLWKIVWRFLTKLLPYDPAITFFGIYLRELENLCPHKNLHMGVYSSFIQNCQNMEGTEMSFSRSMDKLVHPDNGMLLSAKRKWGVKPWKDLEEPYVHITKWRKPIWEAYILYDSNDMTFWKRQNYGE